MADEVEVHLSFWPIGIVGGKGSFHSSSVSLEDLASLCSSKEYGCPMGCFPCPFEKRCGEVGVSDWKLLLGTDEQPNANKKDGKEEKTSQ